MPNPLALSRLNVIDAEVVDNCAVDDPPNDMDALTQSRPVQEVVDVGDLMVLVALPVLDV